MEDKLIGMDTENAEDGSLGQWSIAFRDSAGKLCVWANSGTNAKQELTQVFKKTTPVFHNYKWDARVLKRNRMPLPQRFHDSFIAAYCLGLGRQAPKDNSKARSGSDMVGGLGLKYLARRHLGIEMKTWQDVKKDSSIIPEYNAMDSVATYLLFEKWKPQLPEHYYTIDMPLLPVLMAMEDRGILIDPDYLDQFAGQLDEQLKVFELPINPFSPQQLQSYIYGTLEVEPWKFTSTGMPSTDADVLEAIDDPTIQDILKYRELFKEKGTYTDNYVLGARADGRIHPEFKQTSTSTGRLSCVPLNSEILTREGWKSWNEATVGEEVLGYDIPTKSLKWTTLLNIVRTRDKLGQIHIRGRGLRCTPTHSWVGTSSAVHGLYESQSMQKGNKHQIATTFCSRGGFGSSQTTPTEAGIIGWAITDGHVIKLAHGYSCEIQLVKQTSVKALEELLTLVPHSRGSYGRGSQEAWRHRFYIPRDTFTPMWERAKDNLTQYALSLSEDAQETMFAAMMEADGSPRKRTPMFGAQKKDVLDVFTALCATLGKWVCMTPRKGKDFIDVVVSNKPIVNPRYFHFESLGTEEDVWCPTTGLGTWVMRQDGRVVITGNCANPNLQNVPKEGAMRKLFIAPEGKSLVVLDYKQLEFIVLAAVTQDETILKMLAQGYDFHTMTEKLTGRKRSIVKPANFATIYGGKEWVISKELGITISEAKELQSAIFTKMPGIKRYIDQQREISRAEKKVTNYFGRTRRLDAMYALDWRIRQDGEKEGINTPIQGAAAEIVKLAMIDLHYKHNAKMLLQVHDELVFEVEKKDAKEYAHWLRSYVPKITDINGIYFPIEVGIGQNWREAKDNAK